MEVKQIAAYADMLKRYSRYLREDCGVLGLMAKIWAAERLAGIENQLSVFNLNRLKVRSPPVPRYVLTLQTIEFAVRNTKTALGRLSKSYVLEILSEKESLSKTD
jgi:hypothetical protein